MGYKIEGDGSYQHTKIFKDGNLIPYKSCIFLIDAAHCKVDIDGAIDSIDSILLTGIYTIIGQGSFKNTRVLFQDEILRGVQVLVGRIEKGEHPRLNLDVVMLPNLVEGKLE